MNELVGGSLAMALFLVLIAGCARSERVGTGEYVAPRSEALFLPPELAANASRESNEWESRNTHRLSIRTPEPMLASNQWPQPDRPSLERARYYTIQRQPESILYFRSGRETYRERSW